MAVQYKGKDFEDDSYEIITEKGERVRSKSEKIIADKLDLMDNPEYCQKAINKLEQYEKNGIFIGKNLIVTFETSKQILNMCVVENMLKEVLML